MVRVIAALSAVGLALAAAPASAQTTSHRVNANATQTFDLRLCGERVHVRADGDDDTDLDFVLRDDRGNTVHSDFDTTDLMLTTVNNGTSGCRSYQLEVRNLGDVYNQMAVTLTTQGGAVNRTTSSSSGSTSQSYRIDANATRTIDLRLCARSVHMEARGDTDTDLDFTVVDDRGNTVHTDSDGTDWTTATLRTGGGGCETFRLTVRNLGDVYNQMQLTLTDQ